jgi:hypothetical protein
LSQKFLKSYRLSLEAIQSLTNYAQKHGLNQTEALEKILISLGVVDELQKEPQNVVEGRRQLPEPMFERDEQAAHSEPPPVRPATPLSQTMTAAQICKRDPLIKDWLRQYLCDVDREQRLAFIREKERIKTEAQDERARNKEKQRQRIYDRAAAFTVPQEVFDFSED